MFQVTANLQDSQPFLNQEVEKQGIGLNRYVFYNNYITIILW